MAGCGEGAAPLRLPGAELAQISVMEAAKDVLRALGMVCVVQARLCPPGRKEGLYHLHFGQKTGLLKTAPEALKCCAAALSHPALKAERCWSPPGQGNSRSPLQQGDEGLRTAPLPREQPPPSPPIFPSPSADPAAIGSPCSAQGKCSDPMLPEAPW